MTNKKKALTSAATLARADRMTAEARSNPCDNRTTVGTRGQELINLLGHGQAAAVTARELADRLGVPHREVSRQIERLRADGVPVCASCDSDKPGYYLAEDEEDLERYINSLDRRLRAVRRTREALADTLERETGQIRLEG